jgi:glycine/D-amino acid oxidase-like deaminating enzyme
MSATPNSKYTMSAAGFAQETATDRSNRMLAPDFSEKPYWWEAMALGSWANPAFKRSINVVIVGAGVTGLNAAIELARGGKSVAIFDAEDPGRAASSRNSGFLGRYLKKSFTELIKAYGAAKATAYYGELYEALNVSMKEVIKREKIDCDFDISGRVVLARSHSQLKGMVSEYELRRQHLGEDIKVLDQAGLRKEIRCSDVFCGGVLIPDMASIHPGKYVEGLLAVAAKLGVMIFGNTRVLGFASNAGKFEVETELGTVQAGDVVVATNGYTGREMQWFARRLVPFQGFVIATEEMPEERLRGLLPNNRGCTDDDFDTMAIRLSPDGKRIITSGRTGQAMPLTAR